MNTTPTDEVVLKQDVLGREGVSQQERSIWRKCIELEPQIFSKGVVKGSVLYFEHSMP